MKHLLFLFTLLLLTLTCTVKEKKSSMKLNGFSEDYYLLRTIKNKYEAKIDIKEANIMDFVCNSYDIADTCNLQVTKLCMPIFVDTYDCISKFKNLENLNLVGDWEISKFNTIPKKLKTLTAQSVDDEILINDLYKNLLYIRVETYKPVSLEIIGKKELKELHLKFIRGINKINISKADFPNLETLWLISFQRTHINIDESDFSKFPVIKYFKTRNITFNKSFIDFLTNKGVSIMYLGNVK